MSLRRKMALGVKWSLVERLGNQGFSFVVFMFVARLIGPKDYGLVNVCFVAFSLVNLITLGFADGIISLRITDSKRLSTLFWFVLGVGVLLSGTCFLSAGIVAKLMSEPELEPLLKWFSVVFLLQASAVIPTKMIYASLNFKVFALRTTVASIFGGIVGIEMALHHFGAYSIVAQQIVFFGMMSAVAWYFVRWTPAFEFDLNSLKESVQPGLKMITADMVYFAEDQLPRMFIGGVLGASVLGYFAFATRMRYALQDMLVNPVLSVVYPAIAQIKDDHVEQVEILGQLISFVGLIIYPLLALAAYLAPVYVPLIFGEAWTPAAVVLKIYISGFLLFPIGFVVRESMRAHNRMGDYLRIQIPAMLVNLSIIAIFLRFGIEAVAIGVVGWNFIVAFIYVYFLRRWLGLSLWPAIGRLARPAVCVAIMVLAMELAANLLVKNINQWFVLVVLAGCGVVSYFLVSLLFQRRELVALARYLKLKDA